MTAFLNICQLCGREFAARRITSRYCGSACRQQARRKRDGNTGRLKILVAFEKSGIVRDAFIARGHYAVSCDLQPCERPGPHIQADARSLLRKPWDMVIAHPPCTLLCHSGHPQFKRDPGRIRRVPEAIDLFVECFRANAPKVAVESSFPHRWATAYLGRPDCTVSQKDFGGPGTKRACWWLRGLPPLIGTITDPNARDLVSYAPGEKRSEFASRFHPGMADAMARQWG